MASQSLQVGALLDALKSSVVYQIAAVLGLCILYNVLGVIYNLYLHPLAKFPGPRLAAATVYVHFYYDVVKEGKMIWKIEELHKKYGPIVRYRPDALHVNDPNFIEELYPGAVGGHRRSKGEIELRGYYAGQGILGTKDHDLHRKRRALLNPFFSRQSVRRLAPMIMDSLKKVQKHFDKHSKSGQPLELEFLVGSLTNDIISEYCFGESSGLLDKDPLDKEFFEAQLEAGKGYHLACFLPWIPDLMQLLPQKTAVALMPPIEIFLETMKFLDQRINAIKKAVKENDKDVAPTIFHNLLSKEMNLPESERSHARMMLEARTLLSAGTDTTALTLCAIIYHLLAAPKIAWKLKEELETAIPDVNGEWTAPDVEKLPYLTAIIEEGIRLHPGASVRQERVAPFEEMIYEDNKTGKKWVIPKGTAVGMTAPLLSRNAEIYPDPLTFRPERYIEDPRLTRYLITFSRGTRSCLGMNLAYLEMYLVLGYIFRKYEPYDPLNGNPKSPSLELYHTGREDVDMASDFVLPRIREGSHGVRLLIRN